DIAGLPCSDPTSFNDRFVPPTMEDVTIQACFGNCADDGSCEMTTDSIDVTFQLNTANITVDAGGIFIAGGGTFGVPGDNPMVDPDGDGIYTFTTRRPVGFSSFYTFTNGNCPDFTCKEDLNGLPCGAPANFNDRFLPATMTDITVQACFGNCANDGSCMETSVNGLTIDENLFSLRPTLVNDFINVDFGDNARYQNKQMIIVNSVGQVVHTATQLEMDTYQVDTALYPSGVYAVQVRLGNTMLTKRFVVQ
ncbi:MAG: T9SS type A sorting domain-containing protein, partial [Bacteroidota bacterium]